MTETTVTPLIQPGEFCDQLTSVLRSGAQALLTQAIEAEVASFMACHAQEQLEDGRARLVRHGHLPEREIQTGIGAVKIRQPRVRDRAGKERDRLLFLPTVAPKYMRRSKSLDALIPWLYLKGVSSGDFQAALSALLGADAPNLSGDTVLRLRKVWQALTYLFRQSARGVLQEMAGIIDRFNPDLIHIHGTEGYYGLLSGRTQTPVVISLQGILDAVADAYWGSIPIWRRPQFPLEMLLHWQMRRNTKRENRIIRQARYFTGRTDWDRRMLAGINPTAKYYSDGARLLRREFYGPEWALRNFTRKRLYTTATSQPYKGTDTLLDAVALLRKAHPEISLHIGGHFPERGYGAFLRQRIRALDLTDHVKLLGFVEADDIIAELKAAHAFILGSYIENSPNSVAEAQLVGTPTIATDAGGTPSLVTDGVSGLLYPAGDAAALARQLERLFADDLLADTLSLGGRKCAHDRGGEQELVDTLVTIYRQVLSGGLFARVRGNNEN